MICISSEKNSTAIGLYRRAIVVVRVKSREVVSFPRQVLTYPQLTSSEPRLDSVLKRDFFQQSVAAADRRSGTARSTWSGTARSTAGTAGRTTATWSAAADLWHADLGAAQLGAADAAATWLAAAVAAAGNWSTAGNRSRSRASWSTGRDWRGTGRCTSRSTSSRSCTSRSTSGSSARRSTSRSGTARGGGTTAVTAVVVMEQTSVGAVHAGKGDQRGGNPNKLHCILQVHHGRGNVRSWDDSDPNTTSGGRHSSGERIRVTPIFSTFERSTTQPKGLGF